MQGQRSYIEHQPFEPNEAAPYTVPRRTDIERKNVFVGALWMVGLTLVLFFLPIINGIIGGLVGGYKVGTVRRALVAAIIPAVLVAIGLWIILGLFQAPGVGLITGLAVGSLIVLSDLGILIGAFIGGAIARTRSAI